MIKQKNEHIYRKFSKILVLKFHIKIKKYLKIKNFYFKNILKL